MIAVGVLAVLLFLLERSFPMRKNTRSLLARLVVNGAISALMFVAAVGLVQPAAHGLSRWSAEKPFGRIHLTALPLGEVPRSAFCSWIWRSTDWHLLNHRVPFLWRFHNCITSIQISIFPLPSDFSFWTKSRSLAFSASCSKLDRHFTVGIRNLPNRFPSRGVISSHTCACRLVSSGSYKIVVTPRMHGIHHSQVQRENNSNFGTVFTWWISSRTLGLNIPQNEVIVGIPGTRFRKIIRVANALLMPFRKQRDYWRRSDGTIVERTALPPRGSSGYLAE